MSESIKSPLREVAILFLKLGVIGFGGPAVHIAMMQKEVVRKRNWMSDEQFLDLVSATNLIPGPNSTEMTMHCGHVRAGWRGLVTAGACFILPAVLITAAFSWAYKTYGHLPNVAPFLYGIKPAIIVVIVSVLFTLGKKALNTAWAWMVAAGCLFAVLFGVHEILVLFGAGLLAILIHLSRRRSSRLYSVLPLVAIQVSNARIFWLFLKVGSILYGSGYVLFAFLQAELVSTGLLSQRELIDAVAVGQFTPGPVFSAATFVGWQLNGPWGAALATVGIFLPSFIFVALINPIIPRLRRSKVMSVFLDTVNVASIAIIAAVCVEMGRESIQDWKTLLIAMVSFFCVYIFKNLNSAVVVFGGALLGYLLHLLG